MKIKHSRIYWNEKTKAFSAEPSEGPNRDNNSDFPGWLNLEKGGATKDKRVLSLLTEVIWLVEKSGFDLAALLKEIRKIEEVEIALKQDPYSSFTL